MLHPQNLTKHLEPLAVEPLAGDPLAVKAAGGKKIPLVTPAKRPGMGAKTTGVHASHPHRMEQTSHVRRGRTNLTTTCDVCHKSWADRTVLYFRCTAGCDYDVCRECWATPYPPKLAPIDPAIEARQPTGDADLYARDNYSFEENRWRHYGGGDAVSGAGGGDDGGGDTGATPAWLQALLQGGEDGGPAPALPDDALFAPGTGHLRGTEFTVTCDYKDVNGGLGIVCGWSFTGHADRDNSAEVNANQALKEHHQTHPCKREVKCEREYRHPGAHMRGARVRKAKPLNPCTQAII